MVTENSRILGTLAILRVSEGRRKRRKVTEFKISILDKVTEKDGSLREPSSVSPDGYSIISALQPCPRQARSGRIQPAARERFRGQDFGAAAWRRRFRPRDRPAPSALVY